MRSRITGMALSLIIHAGTAIAVVSDAHAAGLRPSRIVYRTDVQPIFDRRCAFCHSVDNHYGALVLEADLSYSQLVGARSIQTSLWRVQPSKPELSYLLIKMRGNQHRVGGTGTRMPPGWGGLTASEYQTVERWVQQGARPQ